MPYAFSCVSLNVRGLNKVTKRRQVFRWLHLHKFDVVFFYKKHIVRKKSKKSGAQSGVGKLHFLTAQIIVRE